MFFLRCQSCLEIVFDIDPACLASRSLVGHIDLMSIVRADHVIAQEELASGDDVDPDCLTTRVYYYNALTNEAGYDIRSFLVPFMGHYECESDASDCNLAWTWIIKRNFC